MELPALGFNGIANLLASAPGIDAFRQGEQDQIGQNQRNLLKNVGGQAATGNYLQAAQTAMRGGDLDTGMALTKYKSGIDANDTDKRLKLLDFFGRGAQGADTPEKWQSLLSMAQGVYGPETDLSQYGDFNKRDQVVAFLSDSKAKLEREKLQVDLELSREKLTGEREGRAFKSNMLSQFGLMPQGASPAPSYSPPPRSDVPSMGGAAPAPTGDATAGFAAAPSAAQPQSMTPPPTGSEAPVAPPQSPQDAVARLSPTQRAIFGLLISKGDYAGANKLLQDASGDAEAKPPSGYKWSTARPGEQEAIPGGPASRLPADTAGKVGMMRSAISNMEPLRNIFLGEADPKLGVDEQGRSKRKGTEINMFDSAFAVGDTGEAQRLGIQAVESVLRAASGAAVPEIEVQRYGRLFVPGYWDSDKTKARKLDGLERWIGNMLDAIQSGRPVTYEDAVRISQAKTAGRTAAPKVQGKLADPAGMTDDELKKQLGIR